jgi:colanic acid/amylovoran biosynthesis glycosyltransferase
VDFFGSLPSDKTLRILDASQILIAPSKTAADGNSEGIPNVLKEAMLMGLQVISTTHSGIPELIQHQQNGYLCAENDPLSLASVIESVVQNPDKWQTIAEHAANTILADYTPEKTTRTLVKAYRLVLK